MRLEAQSRCPLLKQDFAKSSRLLKSKDFEDVFENGRKIGGRFFVLVVRKHNLPLARLGLVVSKKVGNAPVRNRVKRVIREQFRMLKNDYVGFDVIVIARAVSADASSKELARAFVNAMKRIQQQD
jgi:ribonuclease P protein component